MWDAAGNRTALHAWFGIQTFEYDARNAIVRYVGEIGDVSTSVYDARGAAIQDLDPDSVTTLTYDGVGRVIGTRDTNHAAAELDRAILAYDPVGNPLLKVTGDGVHTMTYDAANQLLSEAHPLAGIKTWSYDPAGNRLSQDFTQVGIRTLTHWTYDPAVNSQDCMCLAGVIFHEMAHRCGMGIPFDRDTDPPFYCYQNYACMGMPSGGDINLPRSTPCAGIRY